MGIFKRLDQDMYFLHSKKDVDEVCSLQAAQGVLVCR